VIDTDVFVIDVGFDWCLDKNYLVNNLIKRHQTFNYRIDRLNFDVCDNQSKLLLKPLFDIFFDLSKQNFNLKEKTPNYKFWSFVSNKDRNASVLHDHSNTAIANGVFYLKSPKVKDPKSGGLLIKKSRSIFAKKHIFPVIEGTLIIFSGDLLHKPLSVNTEEYRISINMEAL
jgi:hypothetical protein|tara:strand:- start:580 stop:1095 length:516 start_codon:yes stop_codon:yes gene_type:complete